MNKGECSVATGSAPKKSTKNQEKKYKLYPKKSTKKVRLQDLTHSNFLFKSH